MNPSHEAIMIRVGAVNYLNAKPLIEGLTRFAPNIDLVLDLPSRLADRLATGELDVGLIPVVEHFRGKNYSMIPGIAIASRGPVLSVTVFSKKPWKQIETVALDEGSRSSAALVKILLGKRYEVKPSFRPLPIDAPAESLDTDAVLLIGDRAMHACMAGYRYAYDLGQEWTEWTGLPMVYAVWSVREGVNLRETEQAFHQAKDNGVSRAGAIAEREAPLLELDAGYCRRYLDTLIRYDLGPDERAGMERYRELGRELGLLT